MRGPLVGVCLTGLLLQSASLCHVCRDKELAKFEAFLNKEGCMHINALVRGRSRMAYAIKR